MRTSASFVALVTLMAAAGTTAAPTGVNPGPGLPALPVPVPPAPHAPHPQRGHNALPTFPALPVSGFKLSNRTVPPVSACDCKPVSTEDVKSTAGADDKVVDAGKAVQDNAHAPDAHFGLDVSKSGEKAEPHSEPQPEGRCEPQPQPQSQPQSQPEPHTQSQPQPQPEQQSQPLPLPLPSGDCLGPNSIHDGLPANACMMVNLNDRKGVDTIPDNAHKAGGKVKGAPDMALDRMHQAHDMPMNVAHDIEKGAQIMDKVEMGAGAVKSAGTKLPVGCDNGC